MQLFGVYEVEQGRVDLYLVGYALQPRLHHSLAKVFIGVPTAISSILASSSCLPSRFYARRGLLSWPIVHVAPARRHGRIHKGLERAERYVRPVHCPLTRVKACVDIAASICAYVRYAH